MVDLSSATCACACLPCRCLALQSLAMLAPASHAHHPRGRVSRMCRPRTRDVHWAKLSCLSSSGSRTPLRLALVRGVCTRLCSSRSPSPPRTHTRHAGERKTLFFPQMIDLDSSCPATPARVLAQGLSDHRSPRTHARHHPSMLAHCHALANQSDVCRMRRRAPAHPQLPYTSCQARPGLLAPRRRASHHAHNLCRCALPAGA